MSRARRGIRRRPPISTTGRDWDPLGFQPLASLQASSLTNPSPQEPEPRPRGEPGPGPSVHPGPAPGGPSPVRPHRRVPVAPRADVSHTSPRRMGQVHHILQPDKSPPSPASVSSSEKGVSQTPRGPPGSLKARRGKEPAPFPSPPKNPLAQTPRAGQSPAALASGRGQESGHQPDTPSTAGHLTCAGQP